jgi:hypothetical protein
VTLPVVWIPDANEELREARAWYDNIRPGLGERFALAVETTVEAIAEYPLQFPVVSKPSPCGSAALSIRTILRGSGASDCGNRLLPRPAQSKALAITLRLVLTSQSGERKAQTCAIGIFRQLSPATRIPDVFETLDPATDTLCRVAMRLIFKFVVFLRIGVFYCLCC